MQSVQVSTVNNNGKKIHATVIDISLHVCMIFHISSKPHFLESKSILASRCIATRVNMQATQHNARSIVILCEPAFTV